MLDVARNLAEIRRSRDLPRRGLVATYVALRVRNSIRSHPPRVRVLDWEVAYADYDTLVGGFVEIFARRLYPFRPRRASPLVVDCGANIGLATLFFKSIAPDARVLAFEPEPSAFALLRENVSHNRLSGVECFAVALGAEPGHATLSTPAPASLSASVVFGGNGWSTTAVDVERLSDLLGDRRVDFLKLDVEGSEDAVLDDLQSSGALARVDELVLEFHPSPEQEVGGLLRKLSDARFQYRISVIGDRIWEPGQLLVVHAFRPGNA